MAKIVSSPDSRLGPLDTSQIRPPSAQDAASRGPRTLPPAACSLFPQLQRSQQCFRSQSSESPRHTEVKAPSHLIFAELLSKKWDKYSHFLDWASRLGKLTIRSQRLRVRSQFSPNSLLSNYTAKGRRETGPLGHPQFIGSSRAGARFEGSSSGVLDRGGLCAQRGRLKRFFK